MSGTRNFRILAHLYRRARPTFPSRGPVVKVVAAFAILAKIRSKLIPHDYGAIKGTQIGLAGDGWTLPRLTHTPCVVPSVPISVSICFRATEFNYRDHHVRRNRRLKRGERESRQGDASLARGHRSADRSLAFARTTNMYFHQAPVKI